LRSDGAALIRLRTASVIVGAVCIVLMGRFLSDGIIRIMSIDFLVG
jgi:hypothetical protein